MKPSKEILRKTFLGVMSAGSIFALAACSQPQAQTPTSPSAEVPTTAATPVVETPTPLPTATLTPTTPTTTGATTANQNLAELANAAASGGSFKTLTKAVQAAGLTEQLAGTGPYTVFAPTDAAFAALPKGTLEKLLKPENKPKLVKLLAYHVVPGQVTSSQLTSGPVKTVSGENATVAVNTTSSTVTVNGAKVVQADIPATNGVVHVVDQVLLPPDFSTTLK